MRRLLLPAACLLAAPLAAQSGTSTWSMTVSIPDSLQAMTQGVSQVDMRMMVATDGRRVALQVEPGPQVIASSTTTDMSGMRIQAVLNATGDSLAVGIVLPPELAAMMGSEIGFRLDLPLDSLKLPSGAADSLENRMADSVHHRPAATGEHDTVAGIGCEVWQTPADSTGEVVTMCMAEAPAPVKAATDVVKRHFPGFTSALERISKQQRELFAGRDMLPLRMTMTGPQEVTMQLLSVSDAAPDPSFFTLPVDLSPFPMEMVKGMMGAAQQQAQPDQEP